LRGLPKATSSAGERVTKKTETVIVLKIRLNELQRFVKNFFFKILSSAFTTVINILIISHYSKVLTVDGFGKFNFLLTYSSYFLLLCSLGMDIVAVRSIAIDKKRLNEIFGALVPLKLILSFSVIILMLLPMIFVPKFENFGWVLVVFSATVLISPFSAQCVFEATKRLEFSSIVAIITQAINYVLAIMFIEKPDDLIKVGIIILSINALTALMHNIFILKFYGKWKPHINIALWKKFIKSGIVVGFIQITVMMIHYIDVFMLGFMKDDIAVGLYSAAYRVMFMIISFLAIFFNLMNPILFENYRNNFENYKEFFNKYSKFMIFSGYGVTVIFIILAIPFLDIVYNLENYHKSILCFRILMISLFFITINSPLHSGLLSAHKEKTLLMIITVQLGANIIGNLILIPTFGIIGSSIATVLTEVVGIAFYIYYFRKIFPVRILRHFVIATITVIPMGIFLYYSTIYFIFRAIIGVIIMAFFVVILRGYTIDEIINFKRSLFNIEK